MKRPYLLIIAIVVFFWALVPWPFFVEAENGANEKPEVCSWPSETMSQYFNFQKEAISILWWSKVEERLMQVTFSKNGLFWNKVLDLPVTAIDLLASGLKVKSSIFNMLTSSVLLFLISKSVVESNVDGLSILFRDRPIVREYKQLLDIETQLFDVAYFRSKQIDLTRPLDWDMWPWLQALIKKYQEIWLLWIWSEIKWWESMSDVIWDLLSMNSTMRHFISWGSGLSDYNWCLGGNDDCNERNSILKFSTWAIDKLSGDYKEVRKFSACNSYLNSIKSDINSIKNDDTKTAVQDVKDAIKRLGESLFSKWRWNFKNGRKNMCDNISEYEMAQLKAYWWPDWECGNFINASVSSDFYRATIKAKSKVERNVTWTGGYKPEFVNLYTDFTWVFNEIMIQYWQSQENAIASDMSDILSRGKWILDQVDVILETSKSNKGGGNKNMKDLYNILHSIELKQCSS